MIPVDRGWTSVEASVGKRKFRFVNTHLEAFGDPKIREAQAKELTKGPLKTSEQVILVGDLNSGDRDRQRAREAGRRAGVQGADQVRDARTTARARSAAIQSLFDANGVFDHTVDHVLSQAGPEDGQGVGHRPQRAERTPSGLWPSDHGGVVSRVRLKG